MKIEEDIWYGNHWTKWLLAPLSITFAAITGCRRALFKSGIKTSIKPSVPTIVVGNITVGGTGKTPLVVYLCEQLTTAGYKPGIISRGYGSKAPQYPYIVNSDSPVEQSGDEPFMLQQRTRCPLVISPVRTDAAAHLLAHFDVDIIITDDGLQHYAMQRDIELIVIDGKRRLGNGHLLPMGPLREGPWRLDTADFVICNGGNGLAGELNMLLVAAPLRKVTNNELVTSDKSKSMVAIAGIGNPQRFYTTLEKHDYVIEEHLSFPDHHAFSAAEIEQFAAGRTVIMTEKDAVKCQSFALDNWYYLPVNASLDSDFLPQLLLKLKELTHDSGS
ncbi:Tetraacyldisaccharide 4'-kinase [Moritella sp. JT01]|uniref:tetraacyldisaccharide 4'-kinase n=1 Tax=Moritella sp. JT01 TaxID=756698 RepID=UPI00079341D5|nr:tetraacyldisaccharide 4'-kinase [Moritella sp. JT01]KXO12510.1 Tetraacyldisaccharide 4'-kinase [Moritella sp. JT01]